MDALSSMTWLDVSLGFIRYSFSYIGRMKGLIGPAARVYLEIW